MKTFVSKNINFTFMYTNLKMTFTELTHNFYEVEPADVQAPDTDSALPSADMVMIIVKHVFLLFLKVVMDIKILFFYFVAQKALFHMANDTWCQFESYHNSSLIYW